MPTTADLSVELIITASGTYDAPDPSVGETVGQYVDHSIEDVAIETTEWGYKPDGTYRIVSRSRKSIFKDGAIDLDLLLQVFETEINEALYEAGAE